MRRQSRSESLVEGEGDPEKQNGKSRAETPTKRTKREKYNIVKECFIDYTASTNLHGLKYLGERERSCVEKVFWLSMFICCVVLCSVLIRKLWIKWDETPVIVSFAENPTPVWQIPYPAVTICFETKARQTVFNLTQYFHLYTFNKSALTEEECNMYEDVTMVCDDYLAPEDGRQFASGADTIANLKKVSPNMSSVFFGCKWKDELDECEDMFSPILTEEGQCYTFNILGANDLLRFENLHGDYVYLENNMTSTGWTLDNGYPSGSPSETYPRKGLGYGAKAGITFVMKANEPDLDYICKGPVQGFKILLHNPAEFPRLSQQYFRAPLAQEVVVAVKPKMMTTSDGLRSYDPSRRKCYFQNERYLQYFKIYTQANCDMECLTNFTYARCGCVHFGVPHGPGMKVCNAGKMDCMRKAQMELVTVEAETEFETEPDDEDTLAAAQEIARECRCLPACTSIEYEAETSQADYNWKAIYRALNLTIKEEEKDMKYSRVMVFFKEAQFITSRRSELYGPTDFLANCGGLLGLFLGFSLLSVVEIFYFLSLRICSLLYRRRKTKKKERELYLKEEIDISRPMVT